MYHCLVVLGALALVIVLLRRKWKTGAALLASALLLAVALPAPPERLARFLSDDWAAHPLAATFPAQTLDLLLLVILVNFLGQVMTARGLSDRLMSGLRAILRSRRLAVAGVPAVMGMLPTPGGIMLSAPMVREAAQGYGLPGARAAIINYWFRHQWESVFPLFPAVPMAAGFLGVHVTAIMKWNLCICLPGLALGALVLLRGFPRAGSGPAAGESGKSGQSGESPGIGRALAGIGAALWPIGLALGLCLGLRVPAGLSLAAAIVLLLAVLRIRPTEAVALFRRGAELDLALVVLGAMSYGAILKSAGAVESISVFISGLGLPVPVTVFLLPFIVGTTTGITSATVALTFPLLAVLIATEGGGPDMRLAMLAFAGGLSGIALTPVHLCLALSREYFKTTFGEMYRYVVPLVLLAAAAAFACALVRF